MRILMLTPAFYPRTGGVERHVRRVSEELGALGHQVCVIARSCPGSVPGERLGDLEVVRVDGGIRALPALLRNHRERFRQADVVHCHDAYPFLYWHLPLRLLLGLPPAFVTFHGYEAYPPPREALLLRRGVRRASAGAICAGGFIPRWYGTPCDDVTYGGVDLPLVPPPEEPEERAVFVGRLERDTGILDILRMLSIARERNGIALPLDICGDGSLMPEVKRLAGAGDLAVRLHGRVDDPAACLRGARFAFASGYLAMWEALACGAMVLALYDNPLKRDYLECFPAAASGGRDAAVVLCGSPEEGAAMLAWLLAHPDAMQVRARAGMTMAAGYTWRRVAGQYLSLWTREAQ